jgi:flavin-dependent dehydrogenase
MLTSRGLDLDLVIVGGGPAGLATALFLGAALPGRASRVVVLEKERYPREKICAGALGARADRLLATLGVRVDVPSAIARGLSVATSRGELAVRDDAVIGRVVRRVEFDHAFADAARARGVVIHEGTRVTAVHVERGSVRIETSSGELRARAVVGADGVGSLVRRAIGAPRGRWLAQVAEVDTLAAAHDGPRDVLHFDLTDGGLVGYAWDFPTIVGGAELVCRGLYELRPDPPGLLGIARTPDDAPDVGARLGARLARLGVAPVGRLKRFSERGLALHEPMARPRALLVGEAAGIDPALGEGIAQAILYGGVAGPYLARCLDRDALAFTDWPRVLSASGVGLDLRLRALGTPILYGRARPLLEAWLARSHDLASVGMRYFAGDPIPRAQLARAAASLGGVFAREAREAVAAAARAATCLPSAPSS